MMQRPTPQAPQGHPFRRTLSRKPVATAQASADDSDMKLFVLSFTAFFICFYTFLL
ncbi:hypothetical protein [Sphingomonas qomolangmaensis]|uniref:Uncharacterized protein n=1 Tax=Sphingomonas qomolangmaensis TaxID=2918765 RepID=A0ABY5LES7_9SPHN|nr:hypothetical protein [Sphingomonas qomolangmaensis]UUL84345.1 hypothetical protein NMP03_06945 [Sphingomonas qomolangmaensis]